MTYSIASLALGLMAWGLPIIGVKRNTANKQRYSIGSFMVCAVALVFQFFDINRRVRIGDYAAIEDTIGALGWVAVILVSGTFISNLLLAKYKTVKKG